MNQTKTMKLLIVLDAIFLLGSVAGNIYAMTVPGSLTWQVITSLGMIVTALFAFYYILAGCKKAEGSKYYKWFAGLYALTELASVFGLQQLPVVCTVTLVLSVAALTVLSAGKDLGKKKSLCLAVCALALAVLRCAAGLLWGEIPAYGIRPAADIVLALSTVLMVFAKYADKASRGSK